MSRDFIFDILMTVTTFGLLVGLIMILGTRLYINKSVRRKRYIELVYGIDNEWYRGKSFDFLMAHLSGAPAMLTAWRFKIGFVTKKQKNLGAYAYPMLHKNSNYINLLAEFRFFVWWEFVKMALVLVGVFAMMVGYGFSEGWW